VSERMRERVHVGAADSIVSGTARLVALPRRPSSPPSEAIVVRDATGVVRAYLNRCRHLPIPLDGASREVLDAERTHLECRTHGALYRLEDGLCIDGPCEGLSLLALPLEERDGELYLLIDG